MYRATLILTASVFLSGLIAGQTSIASEENPAIAMKPRMMSSSEAEQEREALRQLAVTLAAGGEAWRSFRDPKLDDGAAKHPLDFTIPEMNCGVDEIADYVSCYGFAYRGQKETAERRFTQLIDELQTTLPPERWTGAETEPRIGSIRSYTWRDQISDAEIDIDIVRQWSPDEEISYVVTIFGWTAIAPQL